MNGPATRRTGLPLRFWVTLGAITIVLLALGAWLAPHLSRERVEGWVRAAGPWGPIALMGVQIAQILLAPIPGGFVPILAGALYGPIWGPILTSIGTIIGSTAAYWVGRSAGHEVAERWVGGAALEKAHSLLRGKRWLALVPIFLVPFSPADAICFVAGIVKVPWGPFTIAVLVGRLPRDAALAAGVALGWNALLPR
jgi:uncharacterized membrane protein YdjX (TVP38/TMEM64 family)